MMDKSSGGYGEIYNFDWNNDFNNPVLNSVSVKPNGGDTNVPVEILIGKIRCTKQVLIIMIYLFQEDLIKQMR
jgi:hypothetical protein